MKRGELLYTVSDLESYLDGFFVNGTGEAIRWLLHVWVTHLQTGHLYHYTLVVVLGLMGLLTLVCDGVICFYICLF